jgi:hypothetical protein
LLGRVGKGVLRGRQAVRRRESISRNPSPPAPSLRSEQAPLPKTWERGAGR